MSLILNIETATKNCSVSLSNNGNLITYKEIAERIGCSETLVWYKIKRGRELLKEMSENQELF